MKKTLSDIIYNSVYQVLIIFIPIITIPYISRIFGPNLIGINGFIMSIIQFLLVFTLAGLGQFGVRKMRLLIHDRDKLTLEFWSLYFYQLVFGAFSFVLFLLIATTNSDYFRYFMALSPYIFSATIDISWFYQGIEEIKKVVLRNTIVKIGTIILIFATVKSPNHIVRYMLIMSISTVLGNIILWRRLFTYVDFVKPKFENIKKNLSTLLLLIPQISIQVYVTLDKTILGIYSSTVEVAYYDQSQKIARLLISIVTSISLVMMPKMASLNTEDNKGKLNNILKKSYEYTLALSFFLYICLLSISKDFVLLFFGDKFSSMTNLMFLISIIVVFIPVGGVFSNQFALAIGKDRDFTIPVVIGAVLSITLNFIFVPRYGAIGATIVLILVEGVVCLLRIWIIHREFDKSVLENTLYFFISTVISFFLCSVIPWDDFISGSFFRMICKVVFLALIFFSLVLIKSNEISKDFILFREIVMSKHKKR